MELISLYSSTESARSLYFKAKISILCFITVNPPVLIVIYRSSKKTKFMKEMNKNSTDTSSLFIIPAVKQALQVMPAGNNEV